MTLIAVDMQEKSGNFIYK